MPDAVEIVHDRGVHICPVVTRPQGKLPGTCTLAVGDLPQQIVRIVQLAVRGRQVNVCGFDGRRIDCRPCGRHQSPLLIGVFARDYQRVIHIAAPSLWCRDPPTLVLSCFCRSSRARYSPHCPRRITTRPGKKTTRQKRRIIASSAWWRSHRAAGPSAMRAARRARPCRSPSSCWRSEADTADIR